MYVIYELPYLCIYVNQSIFYNMYLKKMYNKFFKFDITYFCTLDYKHGYL